MNRGGGRGGWGGRTAGGMAATSHYVSAVHQGNWSVCDSYCQEGGVEGVMEGRQKEEETGETERRKGGAFCLFFLRPSIPHE